MQSYNAQKIDKNFYKTPKSPKCFKDQNVGQLRNMFEK